MEFKKTILYNVHITRREHWSDKKNYNVITLKEWTGLVNRDHQMQLVNEIEIPVGRFMPGHITRREHWSDKKNYNVITLKEWTGLVNRDHQMQLVNEIEIPVGRFMPGENNIIYKSEGLTFWKIHSFKGEAIFNTWFDYERGNIDVCAPDEETIKKMIAIAGRLGAKVQGDKGEIYDENSFPIVPRTKPWWKFWLQ